jgi:hypothetical protein
MLTVSSMRKGPGPPSKPTMLRGYVGWATTLLRNMIAKPKRIISMIVIECANAVGFWRDLWRTKWETQREVSQPLEVQEQGTCNDTNACAASPRSKKPWSGSVASNIPIRIVFEIALVAQLRHSAWKRTLDVQRGLER